MAGFADKMDFEVRWLPFQLNPNAAREGINKLQYYNDKFGPARTAQIIPAMTRTFAEEGLSYSIGGDTGNTMDSHRLITWAERFGPAQQNALVEELFKAYFCNEQYIGDRTVLLACAERAGLEGAAAVLDDPNAYLQEVQQLMGRARGVGGVPFFVIDKRYKMSGAQPPEQFEDIFSELAAKAERS